MWHESDNRLIREFRFSDFQEAFTFLTRVAFLAEKMNHHPAIYNTYNYVRLELNTHDAGDVVTSKDRDLAKAIDQILN
ncbi:MAG: 4a-hydroxytetrahydrobiopterin dehydratase [Flavobacteriales bacterium]